MFFLTLGVSQSTQREPRQALGEHAKSMQRERVQVGIQTHHLLAPVHYRQADYYQQQFHRH